MLEIERLSMEAIELDICEFGISWRRSVVMLSETSPRLSSKNSRLTPAYLFVVGVLSAASSFANGQTAFMAGK